MKILIAEDDRVIAESYLFILQSRNHDITITYDGEECLKAFEKQRETMHLQNLNKPTSKSDDRSRDRPAGGTPFDLLILDYRMPKKTGAEVAAEVLSKVPGQRILVATAYGRELASSSEASGKSAVLKDNPSVEFIQKPFEFDDFINVVEERGKKRAGKAGSACAGDVRPAAASVSGADGTGSPAGTTQAQAAAGDDPLNLESGRLFLGGPSCSFAAEEGEGVAGFGAGQHDQWGQSSTPA